MGVRPDRARRGQHFVRRHHAALPGPPRHNRGSAPGCQLVATTTANITRAGVVNVGCPTVHAGFAFELLKTAVVEGRRTVIFTIDDNLDGTTVVLGEPRCFVNGNAHACAPDSGGGSG